jgi:hypothetical protein
VDEQAVVAEQERQLVAEVTRSRHSPTSPSVSAASAPFGRYSIKTEVRKFKPPPGHFVMVAK